MGEASAAAGAGGLGVMPAGGAEFHWPGGRNLDGPTRRHVGATVIWPEGVRRVALTSPTSPRRRPGATDGT